MKNDFFYSDRNFNLFDALVSHRQILFRSQKGDKFESNIDLIFFDVAYLQVKTLLESVTITKVNDLAEHKFDSDYLQYFNDYLHYDNNYLFMIEDRYSKFYIAASFIRIFENRLDFSESSLGFLNKGRDKEIWSSI